MIIILFLKLFCIFEHSDSIFYSKYEAKEILEKCSCILNFICQYNSNITRFIIEKFEEFKPSLQYYVHMYRHEDSKSLFEAVESEEECMKESGRKSEATVLIQATFRMYQQKCKWKKIKSGMIALQRLVRQRQMKKDLADSQKQEELKFLQELDNVSVRKKEMERRYKLLSKLHPNRVNSFLGKLKSKEYFFLIFHLQNRKKKQQLRRFRVGGERSNLREEIMNQQRNRDVFMLLLSSSHT